LEYNALAIGNKKST